MDKIILTKLQKFDNPRGNVFHALKKSELTFAGFGEAYFSTIYKNDIKGWRRHNEMTLNLIVPVGEIEFVIYNDFTNEFFTTKLSLNNYQRLTIKPGLWVAFKGIEESNLLLNLASIEHDPAESDLIPINEIQYEW